jgi:prophage antirepressor-like protein
MSEFEQTNELIPLEFETKLVRMTVVNGQEMWVSSDVAEALGYKKTRDAIARHCKGTEEYATFWTEGGERKFRVINEADVFRLIINSKLPEAQRFEKWLFEEVIPSIRKTGRYIVWGLDNYREHMEPAGKAVDTVWKLMSKYQYTDKITGPDAKKLLMCAMMLRNYFYDTGPVITSLVIDATCLEDNARLEASGAAVPALQSPEWLAKLREAHYAFRRLPDRTMEPLSHPEWMNKLRAFFSLELQPVTERYAARQRAVAGISK